jgi:hypothetical protein
MMRWLLYIAVSILAVKHAFFQLQLISISYASYVHSQAAAVGLTDPAIGNLVDAYYR